MSHNPNPLNQITDSVASIAARWMPHQDVASAQQAVATMVQNKHTRVMLFGAYSAGKSLTVNALLGEDVAATGDIPTTCTVTEYVWNSMILQDTPGVNAPVEHERVTQEALNSADMVLFVIRAGDHDSQDVYDRLLAMIAAGKPVLVVLNYEAMQDEAGYLVTQVHQAINQHLVRLAPTYLVSDTQLSQLQILPLQAKTAMKAAVSGKQSLLASSGLPALERALQDWAGGLRAQEGRYQAIRTCVQQNLIKPTLGAIEREVPNGHHPKLNTANNKLARLRSEQSRLRSRIHAEAERVTALARIDLLAIQTEHAGQAELEARLEALYQGLQADVFQFMIGELPELKQALAPKAGNLSAEGSANLNQADLKNDDEITKLLDQLRQLAPSISEDALANLVDALMQSGTKWAGPLQKILQGGAGDFLKANSKYLGVAVAVVLDFVEIGRAAYAEENYNQKLKAEEHRKQQQLSLWIKQISSNLSQTVIQALDLVTEPMMVEQVNYCQNLSIGLSEANADRQSLTELASKLDTHFA
jgi:hypothetical protein